MNPNSLSTLSSLTGLEELIKGDHPSNMSSQTDLLRKLKALQLIEEMISTQEKLLSHNQGDGMDPQQPTDLSLSRESKDLDSTFARGQEKHPSSFPSPLPISLSRGESVSVLNDSGLKGSGGSSGEGIREVSAPPSSMFKPSVKKVLGQSKTVEEGEHAQLSERSTTVKPRHGLESDHPSLKEKREEQLRLLNEKIARRHSKLPHRRDLASKSVQTSSSSSSAMKKTISGSRKPDFSKPKPSCGKIGGRDKGGSKKAKVTTKGASKGPLSSKSAPSLCNSRAPSKVPTSNIARSNKSPPHAPPTHTQSHTPSYIPPSHSPLSHDPHVVHDSQSKATSPQTQLLSLQPCISNGNSLSCDPSNYMIANVHTSLVLDSTSPSQLVKSEQDTAAADDSDLLDSTSYLIPVDGDRDETLVADLSTMTDEDFLGPSDLSTGKENEKKVDTLHQLGSLTSTLTQAYGFSTNSDFLSTLASPHKEEESSGPNSFKPKDHFDLQGTMKSAKKSSKEETSLAVPGSPSRSVSVPISTAPVHEAATVIQAAWCIVRPRHCVADHL